jgi:uncharacterized repeat protein (TIGR03837 family)
VEIRHWHHASLIPFPASFVNTPVRPVHLVIEAFACKLPESVLAEMAAQTFPPVWINLEYLSAEDWVEGCHQLPSPHPALPLIKYFFFPGFTFKTGGVLLEKDLLTRRDAFQGSDALQQVFWRSLGLDMPQADTLKVSLFAYENPALHGLFDSWANGAKAVLCLVPEGRILPQVEQYFEGARSYIRGNLQVCVLPFVEQERYDELLWACDLNFVRGEDSFVRAQWADKPFVWQIYPQQDGVHRQKLHAFMARYCAGLQPDAAQALYGLWEEWNGEAGSSQNLNNFLKHLFMLQKHTQVWANELSANSLVLNLLDFSLSIDRMRDSENLV